MDYVRLGNSGLKVSRICMGALSFGDPRWRAWTLDEAAGRELVKRSLDHGINFFDTANVYSKGLSEETLGKALKDLVPRNEIVITTKVGQEFAAKPNQAGLSRKHIFESIDASLKRLQTDYVDLFLVHLFDSETPVEETVEALADVVRAGKARYLGASSMRAWQFMKMLSVQRERRLPEFVSMQSYINLIYREEEVHMLPLCRSEGIALMPWSALARGFLATEADEPLSIRARTDTVADVLGVGANSRDHAIRDRLRSVARELGAKPSTVALAWLLGIDGVPSLVCGADSPGQIDDAVAAVSLKLTPDIRNSLEELYDHRPLYGVG